MAKIKVNENIHEGVKFHATQYLYNCEGCGYEHAISLRKDGGNHTFNMDLDKPTISPSVLHNNHPDNICHYFIKGGMIQYLMDCHHKLRGKTIELPDYEDS